jgi:hypothetical protein
MAARSVVFATANSTILDHLLPFAPKHANGSIGAAFGAKLRRRIKAIVAIAVALFHFAVGVLKGC